MYIQKQIEIWYNKKTKLKKIADLKKINYCIDYYNRTNNIDKNTCIVNYSSDYEFEFYNLDKMNMEQIKIRPENIFKLNFLIIIKKFKKYFNKLNFDGIQIIIDFEKAGIIDSQLKIPQATYKHDVYIKIEYHNGDNYDEREIGLEYFETIHDRIKDFEKQISSEMQLESYYVYKEKDKKYYEFMKKIIYEIFLNICCILNDRYILSKIIYFEKYVINKNLKQDTLIFNKMIEWNKNDKFNFEEFFLTTGVINPNDEKVFKKYPEFIKYLKEFHEIDIILDKDNFCKFDFFEEIINIIDSDCSPKILDYRKTFTKMMKIMLDASDKILELGNKSKRNKQNLSKYLNNLLCLHITNLKDIEITKIAYLKLKNKFEKKY